MRQPIAVVSYDVSTKADRNAIKTAIEGMGFGGTLGTVELPQSTVARVLDKACDAKSVREAILKKAPAGITHIVVTIVDVLDVDAHVVPFEEILENELRRK